MYFVVLVSAIIGVIYAWYDLARVLRHWPGWVKAPLIVLRSGIYGGIAAIAGFAAAPAKFSFVVILKAVFSGVAGPTLLTSKNGLLAPLKIQDWIHRTIDDPLRNAAAARGVIKTEHEWIPVLAEWGLTASSLVETYTAFLDERLADLQNPGDAGEVKRLISVRESVGRQVVEPTNERRKLMAICTLIRSNRHEELLGELVRRAKSEAKKNRSRKVRRFHRGGL